MKKTIDLTRWSHDKSCYEPDGLKAKLMADLAEPLKKIHGPARHRCIVATYIPPNITARGLIIPDATGDENRWQGKCGLVVKMGPMAFNFDEVVERIDALVAAGADPVDAATVARGELGFPNIGDWVVYRTSETHEIGIDIGDGALASCRVIFDDAVIMTVDDPRVVW